MAMHFDGPLPTDPNDPRLLPPEKTQHCVVCNLAAPMVIGTSYSRFGFGLTPDPGGWMRIFFPWPTLKQQAAGVMSLQETQLICPPCGSEVAKFIAHRREPMLGDEDLIG